MVDMIDYNNPFRGCHELKPGGVVKLLKSMAQIYHLPFDNTGSRTKTFNISTFTIQSEARKFDKRMTMVIAKLKLSTRCTRAGTNNTSSALKLLR